MIKKSIEILKRDGVMLFLSKVIKYFWMKLSIFLNHHPINSSKYWEVRMKYNWDFVGGGRQTLYFASSVFANVDKKLLGQLKSILDYGCATGDASPIFNIFYPEAKIFLHDISPSGVAKALNKFNRFLPVFKWNSEQVDLVYCSNVIEHVSDPSLLVDELIKSSNKFVLIQAPWDEKLPNGDKISPNTPHGEHIWTIDDDFLNKYVMRDNVNWIMTFGNVELSWPGGKQVYLL
jgi:SAM-dependent methyltransferase